MKSRMGLLFVLLVSVGCSRAEDRSKFEFCNNSQDGSRAIYFYRHQINQVHPNRSPMGGEHKSSIEAESIELGIVKSDTNRFHKIVVQNVPSGSSIYWRLLNWNNDMAIILETDSLYFGEQKGEFKVLIVDLNRKTMKLHPMTAALHKARLYPNSSNFMDNKGNIGFSGPTTSTSSGKKAIAIWLEKPAKLLTVMETPEDGPDLNGFYMRSGDHFLYANRSVGGWIDVNLETGESNPLPVGLRPTWTRDENLFRRDFGFGLGQGGVLRCYGKDGKGKTQWSKPDYGL